MKDSTANNRFWEKSYPSAFVLHLNLMPQPKMGSLVSQLWLYLRHEVSSLQELENHLQPHYLPLPDEEKEKV